MTFPVIILSKTASNLDACVDSIRAAGEDCPIIVLDDGLEWIRNDCFYIEGPKPFIFARNANIGIRRAFDDFEADGIFLLNDDTRLLTPMGFSLLVTSDLKDCGVVSCAITDGVGNPQQRPRGIGLRTADRTMAYIAMYIPRSTWELIGPLDERFGIPPQYGWEDNDYNRRVREAGMQLGVFDHCIVEHHVLPSTFRKGNIGLTISDGAEIYRQKWGDLN